MEDAPCSSHIFSNSVETANYSSLFDCQEEKGSKHVKAAKRFAVYFLRLHPAVQSGECVSLWELIVASLQIPFLKGSIAVAPGKRPGPKNKMSSPNFKPLIFRGQTGHS